MELFYIVEAFKFLGGLLLLIAYALGLALIGALPLFAIFALIMNAYCKRKFGQELISFKKKDKA